VTAPATPSEIDTVSTGSCLIDKKEVHPMRWITITLQALLGLMFMLSATLKLTGGTEEIRLHLGIAPWFWAVIALVETVGVMSLLAGIKYPRLAAFGGLWLGATMFGGIVSHVLVADPLTEMIPAIVLMALSLTVVALQWRIARFGDLLNGSARDTAEPRAAAC
jgi:putative oxidoreductase